MIIFSSINFNLGKILFILFFFLGLTYLLNLFLAYLGFDFSMVFQISYIIQLLIIVLIYIKFNLYVDRTYLKLFFSFSLLSIFGIIIAKINSVKFPVETPIIFLFTGLLFPFMLANLYLQCLKIDFLKSLNIIFYYVIFKTTLYLILIPLELATLSNGGFSILQFTGGQYHNIGILLLTLSYAYYFGTNTNIIKILNFLLFITIILSFSRVAILVYLIVLVYFLFLFLIKIILNPKFKKSILLINIFFLFLILLNYNLENIYINDFLNYWMVRLNQIDYEFDFKNIFEESYLENGRSFMLSLIYQKSNLVNLLFGYGIGTSQYILSLFTNGELHFGSFHNLIGTVIAERGIFVGVVFVIYIFYIWKYFFFKKKSFFFFSLFLFFSLTTGVELLVNSRDLNFDITILLLLFIGISRQYKFIKSKSF